MGVTGSVLTIKKPASHVDEDAGEGYNFQALIYGARACPRSKLPTVFAVIFIWTKGLPGVTVL